MDSLLSKFPMILVWLKITDKETVMKRNHKKVWSIRIIDLFQREIPIQAYSVEIKDTKHESNEKNRNSFHINATVCRGGSRISQRGANINGDANLLFGQNFLKTAWKWRKLDRGRRCVDPPLYPWLTHMTCTDFVGSH